MAWHIGFALRPKPLGETPCQSSIPAHSRPLLSQPCCSAPASIRPAPPPAQTHNSRLHHKAKMPQAQTTTVRRFWHSRTEVIKPPPTGDESIHTEVPNPNAGPRDEISPPPQMPGGEN